MTSHPVDDAALVARCEALGLTVATAESLTAGGLCSRFAEVPGVSSVLRGAVVSYTNEVKAELLGVDAEVLGTSGAVDPEVARQMACGAVSRLRADVGLSTTGVAGPEPHQGKPVGTVWIGAALRRESADGHSRLSLPSDTPSGATWQSRRLSVPPAPGQGLHGTSQHLSVQCIAVQCIAVPCHLSGDRAEIRAGAVEAALRLFRDLLGGIAAETSTVQ